MVRASKSKADKLNDAKIEKLYSESCSGVQIPMMDIGKVFAAGRQAIAAGADDAGITAAIVAVVESIRVN
jgi:hypothetical protein